MANKSHPTKRESHNANHSKSHQQPQHQQQRHHTKPGPVGMKNPTELQPSWSAPAVAQHFTYSVLQSPNGQPISWRISGVSTMENTYNTMPRTYPAYPSPPNLGAFPAWTGNPSSSYGPLLAPYNIPVSNTQQLSGNTFVGVSPLLADRGADYAHAGYTQAAIGSDTGASDDGEGEDESSASDASAPHSEDNSKNMRKSSSSSRKSHHSGEPSWHRRHRSRSAVAHRGSAHGQYRQANKAARSLQTVADWLVNDSRSRYH